MTSLAERAAILGVPLTTSQLAQFEQYAAALMEWNQRFNLTAITAPDEIETRHFLDALSALPALAAAQKISVAALLATSATAVDVGSGAGLPGIALKIVWPGLRLTLLEATGKKITFLNHVIELLGLKTISAVQGRAEELARQPEYRERFQLVFARAVAPLPILIEYTLPLAAVGAWVIAYKGAGAEEEVRLCGNDIKLLGARVDKLVSARIPNLDEKRELVLLRKEKMTPRNFPRAGGVIRKRPLGISN